MIEYAFIYKLEVGKRCSLAPYSTLTNTITNIQIIQINKRQKITSMV